MEILPAKGQASRQVLRDSPMLCRQVHDRVLRRCQCRRGLCTFETG
jgi:hypothetical protein